MKAAVTCENGEVKSSQMIDTKETGHGAPAGTPAEADEAACDHHDHEHQVIMTVDMEDGGKI